MKHATRMGQCRTDGGGRVAVVIVAGNLVFKVVLSE